MLNFYNLCNSIAPIKLADEPFDTSIPKTPGKCSVCLLSIKGIKGNETVSEYVANLRKLTEHCQFGGIQNEAIQKQLTEVDLVLKCALTPLYLWR